jgi:hypothetical protein
MQRKQQVGECWVCVIFFACVCVWARQIRQLRLTIPSVELSMCIGRFPRGVPGGAGMPPLVTCSALEIFFWAVFAIFSRFVN